MSRRFPVYLLLACAFGWVSAQAGLLLVSEGLLASYDFPSHFHMSAVQMRHPHLLWDDGWYAGYPTYAYPPLAHRFAAELMEHLGVELGFKIAVSAAYVASVPAVFAAARIVGGLPPMPAAAATLLVVVSPALFRAFLFGQYPTLVAYPLFLLALAALFAQLRSRRANPLLGVLGALLIGALGSAHLYSLLLLAVALLPLIVVCNRRLLVQRLALPAIGGGILALVPSLLLLFDLHQLSKTPVPHITRSVGMIQPAGLLDWVIHPAGLPIVLGVLALSPTLAGSNRGVWVGAGLAGGLLLYVGSGLEITWLALATGFVLLLALRRSWEEDWLDRYLVIAAVLSLWLSLGPVGGLARLLPFSDVLVYDRPLLFAVPVAGFALTRAVLRIELPSLWRRVVPVGLAITSIPLLLLSVHEVLVNYAWTVPGAERAIPSGTTIRAEYRAFFAQYGVSGRMLPLGFPPIVYVLPDLAGVALIDGGYNDARVLTPFRRSGLDALGNEKFTNRDLRMTRFFLAHAESYRIEWVMTADRAYDHIIPLDKFMLVHESTGDQDRRVRFYKALFSLGQAWEGPHGTHVADIAELPFHRGKIGANGGVIEPEGARIRSALALELRSASPGWESIELAIPTGVSCNRASFEAWSPTGASLTVRVLKQGHWTILLPETTLDPDPAPISLALNCADAERLHFGISGGGSQKAFVSPVRLQSVEDLTRWVRFQRLTSECFRISLPRSGAKVTVSVPYFPRWHSQSPSSGVATGADALGLLTLTGRSGTHTMCLKFPLGLRLLRSYLPATYVLGSVLVGALILRQGFRPH